MPRKKQNGFAGTTHVVLVLDESGSMAHLREQGVSHVAEQLKAAAQGKNTRFTLWFFGDHIPHNSRVVWDRVNPTEVVAHECGYSPTGMTPLYDAVARAVHGTQLGAEDRALIVIFTDGMENASREYSRDQIKALVAQKEQEGNWTFLFLAAGFDQAAAQQYAHSVGIQTSSSTPASPLGIRINSGATGQAVNNYVSSPRRGFAGQSASELYAGVEHQHATAKDAEADRQG